jgi:nicotinamide-nucleotide amidase
MISGSNTIVGLALALQQLGGVIAPIFAGSQVEHRKKVMPAAMWMGGLGRVAILCMALAGWFLKGQALLWSLLFFIAMFGLFMGAQRVVFGLLMAKVIPTSRRGRLQAWRNATGGLIAATLTAIAGSSDVVDRGFVTYSNDAKSDLVGVPPALIAAHGAVSEPVARAMAEGALARSRAGITVAVTGVAGPGGGSAEKPVGLVWFGCARRGGGTVSVSHIFPGSRADVRRATVAEALRLIGAAVGQA